MIDVTMGLAFIAGFLSFISPCVLPLIPAYISYLGGRATRQVSAELAIARASNGTVILEKNRIGVLLHGLAFVTGFTLMFIAFGLIASAGFSLLRLQFNDFRDALAKIGGVITIFFGLHVLGLTGWLLKKAIRATLPQSSIRHALENIQGILYGDTRRQMNPHTPYGYFGSTGMGMVFAAGWSPCIGPILGSILTLGASREISLEQVTLLLLSYSLGLGIPFLAAALALDNMRGLMKRLQRHMRVIEVVSGVFLIMIGVMLLMNTLTLLSQQGSGFADFSYNLEACGTGIFEGTVPIGEFGRCMNEGANYKYQENAIGDKSASLDTGKQSEPIPGNVDLAPIKVSGLDIDNYAPDFTTQTLDNRDITLNSLRGKVVLLNFWATWCGPCRREMPDFQRLVEKYGKDGFVVLAVNFRESPEQINKFLQEINIDLLIGLDLNGEINRQFEVNTYPVTYVLGRGGEILAKQTGVFELDALKMSLQKWLR